MNQEAVDRLNKFAKDNFKGPFKKPIILEEEIRNNKMKLCCPHCNSTNVITLTMDDDTKKSECQNEECGYLDLTEKFPIGEYKVNVPFLSDEINNYCDEMKITKTGFFYKNASAMIVSLIPGQIKPWQDENKKLKLLIDVIEKKMGEDFVKQALALIEIGDDTIETEDGILILSYQEKVTEPKDDQWEESDDEEGSNNVGDGSLH